MKGRKFTFIHPGTPEGTRVCASVRSVQRESGTTSHVTSAKPTDATWPLTENERDAIRRAVQAKGEPFVAGLLSLKRHTMARVLAGLPVQRGTVALVRQGLAAHGAEFEGGPSGGPVVAGGTTTGPAGKRGGR